MRWRVEKWDVLGWTPSIRASHIGTQFARCVIDEYEATQKWFSIKNQYAQVHIGTLLQAKYF